MTSTRERIDDFLHQKRIAMVGVSRHEKDFSRSLFREFEKRGFEMVPVHPEAAEIDGRACYRRLQDIQPPVDGALLMTTPAVTDAVVEDCAEAGVRRVWMYRATGEGAVSRRAVKFCREKGIDVVPGYCPFMFFENTAFFHRVHGVLLKLAGKYPQ
ncbi:MAG: CoA-binding protein [Bryobacteraceae bacterium]|nr:CoA-binding protein [Bryobacteraceae bacterium]